MGRFTKKPVTIEAITFDELVEHGKASAAVLHDGIPWSFTYKGHSITHERDDCYLIPTLEGAMQFTRGDVLITGIKGEIYPCKRDIFDATYSAAGEGKGVGPSEYCLEQMATWGRPSDVEDAGYALMIACHQPALNAGWWVDTETGEDVRSWPEKFFKLWVATKLALVHSEVSEGLEGHRKDLQDDKLPERKMLEVELADAVIRIFDLAGGLGYNLGAAIAEKLVFNTQRSDHKVANRTAEGGKSY